MRGKSTFSLRWFGALALASALVGPLAAQSPVGEVTGRVVGSDGLGVPGVRITLTSPNLQGSRMTTTGSDGRYQAPNLPPGEYKVTAELEGFATGQRSVNVRSRETSVAHFGLQLAEVTEEITVTSQMEIISMTSGAINRPATARQSDTAPGSIVVGYTRNAGPVERFVSHSAQLAPGLPGLDVFILSGGVRHNLLGLYSFPDQFAAVVPSAVNPSLENLFMINALDANGEVERQSNAYKLNVSPFQPGFFTRTQDGQGAGIFTDPQFNLVTMVEPAMPEDFFLGWGSGHGPTPLDNQGLVHDKRGLYDEYSLYVGGVIQSDPFYVGSAGGFAGGDQIIWQLNPNVPLGCAVPVYDHMRAGDVSRMSNVVTLPISADGGPCGDPHGLSPEYVEKLSEGSLKVGTMALTEVLTTDGEIEVDTLEASFRGSDYDTVSYDPPIPLGTCKVGWLPRGFQSPFAPRPLQFAGNFLMTLPGLSIPLGQDSNRGPYLGLFGLPDSAQLTGGRYSITTSTDFSVDGEPFSSRTWHGDYRRDAGRAKDAVRGPLIEKFREDGWVSAFTAIGIAADAGVGSEVFMRYDIFMSHGPFGNYQLTCFMPGGASALSEVRDSIQQQSCEMATYHLPADPEQVNILISFLNTDQNQMLQTGPVDATQEVIGARVNLVADPQAAAIVDTQAFATCP